MMIIDDEKQLPLIISEVLAIFGMIDIMIAQNEAAGGSSIYSELVVRSRHTL